nr:uncharacterized protein K02A2.6-like [Procambarus clarkii]
MERVRSRYFWYGLSTDVANYVASCHYCSMNKKASKTSRHELLKYHAGASMERVHLDILGPLPKTPKGSEYLLVMVDQFTKWIECVPLPSQTAEDTARAALDGFFTRFGYPFEIFTDQGRNFESDLFTKLCELMHIHKAQTTAYRPSANGQVERYNRTIMDALRCYASYQHDSWDTYIQHIAGTIRSSVNRQTGFTPNKLMLGWETNQPIDLMYPREVQLQSDAIPYLANLQREIEKAHALARKSLSTNQERMKRYYDLRARLQVYEKGDLVYLLDTAQVKGQCRKISPQWKGPGVIIHKFSSCLFRVKLQNDNITANHDKLKKCKDLTCPGWIEKFKRHVTGSGPSGSAIQGPLLCVCRQPYDGKFMVQCDMCAEWFHGVCVGVTLASVRSKPEYACPRCESSV